MTDVKSLRDDPADASGAGRPPRWARVPGTLSREVRAGVLVLARSAPDPLLLVGAGWVVWHMLADPVDFDEACRSIAEEFEAPLDETSVHLGVLLEQLVALDLVVPVP